MDQIEKSWLEHQDILLRFIAKRVQPIETAEDLLHDVFEKFHVHFASISEPALIRSWLFRVTRNVIIDHYRSRTVTVALPESLASKEISNHEAVQQDLAVCIENMVHRLPDKYRTAVQLADINGQPQQDLAVMEEISLSGAKSRVQRGRRLLRKMLYDCCSFELDSQNSVIGWTPRQKICSIC